MPRPETPPLAKGDKLFMYSGTPWPRSSKSYKEVVVVTLGPKYVGVVDAGRAEAYAADPAGKKWIVRKFLREDMTEGERGKRFSYSATLATAEQRAYDERQYAVAVYLRDVLGVDVRRGGPLDNPDTAALVVYVLRLSEDMWRPSASIHGSAIVDS